LITVSIHCAYVFWFLRTWLKLTPVHHVLGFVPSLAGVEGVRDDDHRVILKLIDVVPSCGVCHPGAALAALVVISGPDRDLTGQAPRQLYVHLLRLGYTVHKEHAALRGVLNRICEADECGDECEAEGRLPASYRG
jgi:hypothetical protein